MQFSLPVDYGPTSTPKHEVSTTPIVIPPTDVEMTDSSAPILYLSSFVRSIMGNSPNVSFCDFVEPSSSKKLISTSVDIPCTSHISATFDDAYMNLVSYEEARGTSSPSCGISSSSLPIFHSNEDIMEAITTRDYPCDDMHHHAYFLPQQTHDQHA